MDWITTMFAPLAAWVDAHPSVVAWGIAWLAALSTAQAAKQLVFPPEWSVTAAKRATQAIAMLVGTLVSYLLWPGHGVHNVVYAIVVGMSAPTAYTFAKAIIEWRLPGLARALSWSGIQAKAGEDEFPECRR